MKRIVMLGALSLAFVACDADKSAAGDTAASATTAEAAAEMTDEQIDAAEIPVEEDFEDAAAAAINSDNLDDQLDALEKEIEGDS